MYYSFKPTTSPLVLNLIIINVVVFFAGEMIPGLDLYRTCALHSYYGADFKIWQFVTYMFMHANIIHLAGNMFGLYMFGSWLEKVWGPKRFLFFYFFTGIGAALVYWGINSYQIHAFAVDYQHFVDAPSPELALKIARQHFPSEWEPMFTQVIQTYKDYPDSPEVIASIANTFQTYGIALANIPMLGASGAIFGILMAYVMLFPNTELRTLFLPIVLKAKYFVLIYGLYELYMQFKNVPGDTVSHLTHLSGMLFAFILVKYWNTQRNSFY